MRYMDQYFDDHGLLGMLDRDMGDSCQKTGFYRYIRFIQNRYNKELLARDKARYEQELDMFEVPGQPGLYCRHPDPTTKSIGKWWANPKTFSRDQQRAMTMAMGAYQQRTRLYKLTLKLLCRFGFYQNTRTSELDNAPKRIPDWCSPENWAEIFRAFWQAKCYWAILTYPLIILGDLWKIANILISTIHWTNPDEADDDNLIQSCLQSRFSLATPFSYLAIKLYLKLRPVAGYIDQTKKLPLRDNIMERISGPASALKWKHRESTGAPPLYEYSKNVINTYL